MGINWKKKLTSRKFWAAVVGFVTALMIGFGCAESTAAEITSIVMAGATLIAYIIGEGMVDAASVSMFDEPRYEIDDEYDDECEDENECP